MRYVRIRLQNNAGNRRRHIFAVDIDLGFHTWLRDVRIRLSDVSAPEKGTPEGKQWIGAWQELIQEQGNIFTIRTMKDTKQTLSRWLGALFLLDGCSVADRMDPDKQRRFKHEG